MRAFYEVISGPAGAPRDWRRDSTLYSEGATFVAMDVKDGKPVYAILTAEEYRRKTNASFVKNGFFETEIGSRIERFGNVAQVRSVYETRRVANGPLDGRGVNYLTVFWDGTRWWITGAVWDDERPDNPAPAGLGRSFRDGALTQFIPLKREEADHRPAKDEIGGIDPRAQQRHEDHHRDGHGETGRGALPSPA